MTGILKLAAVGAVTGISALTALRLSRIKKDFKTRVSAPSKAEIIRGQLRLYIPVTLFNYTGLSLTPKRLRIEVIYPSHDGSETLLAISPQQTQTLPLKKDGVLNPVFQIDVDPTTLLGLKRETPITVRVKFDYLFFPIDIDTVIKVADFIPIQLNNSLSNALSSLLKKIGLLGQLPNWTWINPNYKNNPSQNSIPPIIPIGGFLPTLNRVVDYL